MTNASNNCLLQSQRKTVSYTPIIFISKTEHVLLPNTVSTTLFFVWCIGLLNVGRLVKKLLEKCFRNDLSAFVITMVQLSSQARYA